MLRRPLVLWLVSIGLILSPAYYYIERVLLSGIPWSSPVAVLSAMPGVKLGAAALGLPVGVLLLRVHAYSWYAIFGYGLYTMAANLALYLQGGVRLSLLMVFVASGFLLVLYFTRREIVSPFFNPRLRGWESDRVRYRAKADLVLPTGESIEAQSWDVSPSGVYLETPHPLEPGTSVDMTLHMDPAPPLEERVEIVWRFAGDAERPAGVGARFARDIRARMASTLEQVTHRAHARVPFRLRVDVEGKSTISCETFDLSRTGCYLVTEQEFRVGEALRLTLHLDGPLDLEGTVVRVATAPRGVGVRFSRTPLRLRSALQDFHARRAEASS
jgi:hypothetical protein